MNKQSEHDAVAGALAAYEAALDRYDDVSLGGADDWVIQEAANEADDLLELLHAAREAAGIAAERITPKAPAPPAETAWLRDITLEW